MSTYSFLDTQGSFVGPGGNFSVGSGAGCAEEGISYALDEDQTGTITGSDGTIMHSLHASQTGTVTVRLLKTSPVNGKLQQAYNFQKVSASTWGVNTLAFANSTLGDAITLTQAAFVKSPDNSYAKDGNIMEWVFRGYLYVALGKGALANIA
jgi:hypothetical protein